MFIQEHYSTDRIVEQFLTNMGLSVRDCSLIGRKLPQFRILRLKVRSHDCGDESYFQK